MKIVWKRVATTLFVGFNATENRVLGVISKSPSGWMIVTRGDTAATTHPTLWGAASSLKRLFNFFS